MVQEKVQKYSKVKIYYSQQSDLQLLGQHGVAIDHGVHKSNVFIESVFSEYEIKQAEKLGYQVAIEIDDMSAYIANRNATDSLENSSCTTSSNYTTPSNFELGSMGGFYTYSQMLQELDDMHTQYPNLITAKAPISTFQTFNGNPIYSVKISDNPTIDETEPEMMFSAIHHAREPASMQQLIFYMWYLLENYATDPEIQAIVDNTEQYFIPVLNVDGYLYNEQTNPNGGGFWRKNRRNNGDGSFGVDNNRNYSYHWNQLGVGNNGYDQTWPGTAAFSEPENQAMKWFCEQHNFIMGINNHSYSALLLFPFGYDVGMQTPEHDLFTDISGLMVSKNGYTNQIAADLYPASGDSDDWMYADTSTKNKIYAMTPEIGHSFWPAPSSIVNLCKDMMFHNLTAVHLITNYATVTDLSDSFLSATTGNIDYQVKRFGLQEPANFIVSLIPVSANITSVGNPINHNGMTMLQEDNNAISYMLSNTIQNGDEIVFQLALDNGDFITTQEITKIYGTTQTIFFDSSDNLGNYNASTNWEVTNAEFYSPSNSITDSKFGNYSNNTNSIIVLNNAIDLSLGVVAKVYFYAKWEIEAGWDYVQFEISTDNGSTWVPQCGNYTKNAVADQNIGTEPMYDGTKSNWVKEEIDLSDYLGQQIKFRFQLFSDGGVRADGFYFDDFEVKGIFSNPATVDANEFVKMNVYPNPSNSIFTLKIPSLTSDVFIQIYSINGSLIKELSTNQVKTDIDLSNYASGIYFMNLTTSGFSKQVKLVRL